MKHVAGREGVVVKEIKPTCPRCGHISRTDWKGYVYFKCVKCDYEADRDRAASLNIALRATHVADPTKGQNPQGN